MPQPPHSPARKGTTVRARRRQRHAPLRRGKTSWASIVPASVRPVHQGLCATPPARRLRPKCAQLATTAQKRRTHQRLALPARTRKRLAHLQPQNADPALRVATVCLARMRPSRTAPPGPSAQPDLPGSNSAPPASIARHSPTNQPSALLGCIASRGPRYRCRVCRGITAPVTRSHQLPARPGTLGAQASPNWNSVSRQPPARRATREHIDRPYESRRAAVPPMRQKI